MGISEYDINNMSSIMSGEGNWVGILLTFTVWDMLLAFVIGAVVAALFMLVVSGEK